MLRVAIQQPTLAGYRVPFYQELAARADINLTLLYGDHGTLPNAAPDGFCGRLAPLKEWRVLGQPLIWHQAQIEAVASAEFDVAVLSWSSRYVSLPLAMRKARRLRKPVLLWGHGYSLADSRLKKLARDKLARGAAALLFYDERTAQRAVEDGWRREQVFVAPNAIDQSPIQKARQSWLDRPEALAKFRRDNDLEGREVLLYVSRMIPENRLELLVNAVATLAPDRPQLSVVLVGGGDDEARRLMALAEELSVGDRFRFTGAIYEEQELGPWFLCADLFVYPASIGLSLLHAFGYGLPVVTSGRVEAQNPEIIALNDGVNGLLYAPETHEALGAAIAELLDDPGRREQMGQAALETVQNRYSIGSMVDGMVEALRFCGLQRPVTDE